MRRADRLVDHPLDPWRIVGRVATVIVEVTHERSVVECRVGDVLELVLDENATTGFRWLLDVPGASASLSELDTDYTVRSTAIGGGGVRRFRLDCSAPGSFDVELRLVQPWDEAGCADRRHLDVVVREQPG